MIDIDNGIKLFDIKIEFQAIRSNGPGGQHVNKVSTAIILKYNLNVHNYPEWFLKSIKINAKKAQLSNKNIISCSAMSQTNIKSTLRLSPTKEILRYFLSQAIRQNL